MSPSFLEEHLTERFITHFFLPGMIEVYRRLDERSLLEQLITFLAVMVVKGTESH